MNRRIDYKLKFCLLTNQIILLHLRRTLDHCNNRSNALINGLTVIDSLNETL